MTEQKQPVSVGANYICPKQRLTTGRMQYATTVKGREKKQSIKNTVTFVYLCYFFDSKTLRNRINKK